MMKYKGLATVVTVMGVFGGAVVATSNTHATGVADQINVTIPVACSLTSIVDSAHTTTVENSAYEDEVGETTFKVFCNDAEGFAVYAVGYTNDSFGNNTLKPTNLASSYAIATGTSTSGDTSNWAMKLTAVTGTYAPTIHSTEENSNTYSFTSYHTVPAEYTKVASYSSNTDATTGSSFKSTYAVYASPTQPADSYTGKVKYTIVHPANADNPGKTISQLTYMQDFKDLTAEQRVSVLNSMAYNTIYSLIDNRDNKTYQIARLKDDNIWMAENLDLGRTTITTDLTSTNTNLDANATTITASTFNSWIKSSGTETYTSAELIPVSGTDSTSNTPYGTLYNYCAASAGAICSASDANNNDATSDICPAGWRLPTGNMYNGLTGEFQSLYNLEDYNTNAKMRAPIADGGAAFALAGRFYGSTPTDQEYGSYWSSTRFTDSAISILFLTTSSVDPTVGGSRVYGESVRCVVKRPFYSITVSYGTGISDIKVDNKTVQDGRIISLEQGTHQIVATPNPGYGFSSWSTTAGQVDNTNAQVATYTLNENVTISAAASYVSTEIQNIASSNCTTTTSQARDNRDNHVYTIQRLADGKCWMIDNLDLGRSTLSTDLTSSNTNLNTTITASTFNSWKTTNESYTSTYDNGVFVPQDGIDYTSETQYGTLYNYYSASAGTILGNSNSDNAPYDICPAGWRLPTSGSSGEFQALYNNSAYNTYDKLRAPISAGGAAFNVAGYHNGSKIRGINEYSGFWSSTIYDTTKMYDLWISNPVMLLDKTDRKCAFNIRCILK